MIVNPFVMLSCLPQTNEMQNLGTFVFSYDLSVVGSLTQTAKITVYHVSENSWHVFLETSVGGDEMQIDAAGSSLAEARTNVARKMGHWPVAEGKGS